MADKDASSGQSGPAGAARGLARGHARLDMEHVQQAELGCDFDFLRASRGGGEA